MLTLLSVLAFVVAIVVHEGGGDFLFDWAGWMLVGLALFAAGHLYPWAPWRNQP